MIESINPFHDLYLTEAIGSDSFVKLFSPMFMHQGTALFQPGNVVLSGLQGSGKTMLLNLLRPEIRIAYHHSKVEFPVPVEYRTFVSAGINLRKSGIADFAQLITPNSENMFLRELALTFGDFFNYWIVNDLIRSIELICNEKNGAIGANSGVDAAPSKIKKFAQELSRSSAWLGGIVPVDNLTELKDQLQSRIIQYRNYLNLNVEKLPTRILKSKSVIGEPISLAADVLRNSGVISEDTNIFVRIDQYEELPSLDYSNQNFGVLCQELIHKALSARSSRVSYRIGVRQYAWPVTPKIFSTNGCLELKRDYSTIDIDDKLRRSENRKTWLFPSLAEDVFARRLRLSSYKIRENASDLLGKTFGKTLTPKLKAESLVASKASRRSLIEYESSWPDGWCEFLDGLVVEDPFSAKLAGAWVRQRDPNKRNYVNEDAFEKPYPWEKTYWKKERAEQALTQLASRNRQQMIWQGKDDLIGLSGGNILVFLFLCQHIWDTWLRMNRNELESLKDKGVPSFDLGIQSLGILNASEEWQRKPLEGMDSKRRSKFIQAIGARYYKLLTDDVSMSNPGKNGFTVSVKDLDNNEELSSFLKLASDYGDLYEAPHTSKIKGELRKKYYLAPILCPSFRISYKHTKEPEYLKASVLLDLLRTDPLKASVSDKKTQDNTKEHPQKKLFE